MRTPTFTAEASLYRGASYRVSADRGRGQTGRMKGKFELASECFPPLMGSCGSGANCVESEYNCYEVVYPCASNPDGTVEMCVGIACEETCTYCCRWGYSA